MPLEIIVDQSQEKGFGLSFKEKKQAERYEAMVDTVGIKPLANIKMYKVDFVAAPPKEKSNTKSAGGATVGNAGGAAAAAMAAAAEAAKAAAAANQSARGKYESVLMSSSDKYSNHAHLMPNRKKTRKLLADPRNYVSSLTSDMNVDSFGLSTEDGGKIDLQTQRSEVTKQLVGQSYRLALTSRRVLHEHRFNSSSVENERLDEMALTTRRVIQAQCAPTEVVGRIFSADYRAEVMEHIHNTTTTRADELEIQLLSLEAKLRRAMISSGDDPDGEEEDDYVSDSSTVGSRAGSIAQHSISSKHLTGVQRNQKKAAARAAKKAMQKATAAARQALATASANGTETAGVILERGLDALKTKLDKDMAAEYRKANMSRIGTSSSSNNTRHGSVFGRRDSGLGSSPQGSPMRRQSSAGGDSIMSSHQQQKDSITPVALSRRPSSVNMVNINHKPVDRKLIEDQPLVTDSSEQRAVVQETTDTDASVTSADRSDGVNQDDNDGEIGEAGDDDTAGDAQSLQPTRPEEPMPSSKTGKGLRYLSKFRKHGSGSSVNVLQAGSLLQIADKFLGSRMQTPDRGEAREVVENYFVVPDGIVDAKRKPLTEPMTTSIIVDQSDEVIKVQAITHRNRKLERLLNTEIAEEQKGILAAIQKKQEEMTYKRKPVEVATTQYFPTALDVVNRIHAKSNVNEPPPNLTYKDKEVSAMAKAQALKAFQAKSSNLQVVTSVETINSIKNPHEFGVDMDNFLLDKSRKSSVAMAREAKEHIEHGFRVLTKRSIKANEESIAVCGRLVDSWDDLVETQQQLKTFAVEELKEKRFALQSTTKFRYMEQSHIERFERRKTFKKIPAATTVERRRSPPGKTFMTEWNTTSSVRAKVDTIDNLSDSGSDDSAEEVVKELTSDNNLNATILIRRKYQYQEKMEIKHILDKGWYLKLLKRIKRFRQSNPTALLPLSLLKFLAAVRGVIVNELEFTKDLLYRFIFDYFEKGDHSDRLIYKIIITISDGMGISPEALIKEYRDRRVEPHNSLSLQVLKNAKLRKHKKRAKARALKNLAALQRRKLSPGAVGNLDAVLENEEEDGEEGDGEIFEPVKNTKAIHGKSMLTAANIKRLASHSDETSSIGESVLDDVSDTTSVASNLEDLHFDEGKWFNK